MDACASTAAPRKGLGRLTGGLLAAAALIANTTPAVGAQIPSIATSAPVLSSVATWNAPPTGGPVIQASLSLVINSGNAQTIPALIDNRINVFPLPVNVTTQWNLSSLISLVDLVGYFSVPGAALQAGTTVIPSSRMEGRVTTGRPTTFAAFTQAPVGGVGAAGGSLHLFRQLIIAPLNGVGQRTDNLDLRLDLRGLPNLAAGTYTGTLTLRAIAY